MLHRLPGNIKKLGSAASHNIGTSGDGVPVLSANNSFSGINSVKELLETATVAASAATGTINFDVLTQSVLFYTTDASANFTLNVRGDASNTLDSLMAVGQSCTVVFLATQGATAYYCSAVDIDGTAVTPKWQGGSAPTSGNASGIDAYTLTVIKTAAATFTVLAAQTQFT